MKEFDWNDPASWKDSTESTVEPLSTPIETDAPSVQAEGFDWDNPSSWEAEEPVTMDMDEPEDNTGASLLENTVAQWGHASGTLARQMGEGLREWLGADTAARFFENIGDSAERYWSGKLTPEEWQSLQKKASQEFLKVKEGGDWYDPRDLERGEAGLESLWYKLVGSGPAMTAGMAGGMGAGSVAMKGLGGLKYIKGLENTIKAGNAAKAAGGSAQAIKAGKSAERMMKFIQGGTGALAYGATEGGISALASGSEAKARVQEMPFEELLTKNDYAMDVYEAAIEEGMDPEQAAEHTRDYISDLVYKETSSRTFLTTAAAGAVAGWALGPIIARTPFGPEFSKGFLRGGLKGAAAESGQEAVQSGFEQYWQNVALKEYADNSIKESEGVFSSVIDGVVTGAAFGGPIGAIEGGANRRQGMALDQEQNQENTTMFEAHMRMADAALNERGWTEMDRIAAFEPIAQELADTGNIVKAVSDLRSLERTGELRQLGGPQPEGIDIPMAPQYKAGEERNGITLTADYGEFPGTIGADGDPIDFYYGGTGQNNYIIRKRNEDGTFQQHKVMVGYETEDEAIAKFYENSDPAYDSFMDATEVDQAGLKDFLDVTTAKNKELEQEAPDLTEVPDEFLQAAIEAGEDIPFAALSPEQKEVFSRAGVVETVTTEEEGAIPYDVIPSRTLATEYERRRAEAGPPAEPVEPISEAAAEAEAAPEEEATEVDVPRETQEQEEPPMSLAEGERPPLRNPKNIRSLMAHVTPRAADFESKLTPEEQDQALKAVNLKPEDFDLPSQKHHALRLWAQADRTHEQAKKELTMTKVDGNPAVDVRYVHQSVKPDLTRLKKAMYRTGASQSPNAGERKWVDRLPKDKQDRVFFNVVRDGSPKSGEQLSKAPNLYTGKATKLYDMHADPLRLSSMTMPEIEAKLRDMGYNGIVQTDQRGMYGWTWTDLAAAYQGTSRGLQGKRLLQEPSMARQMVAFETLHGRVSPIYAAMQKLNPQERADYHRQVLGAITDADYREDKLAKILGAAQRLIQTGEGAWEGGLSPNAAVSLNSEAEADFYANAVRFIFNQDSAGWMKIEDGGNETGVAIEKKDGWTQDELQALAKALPEDVKGFTQVGDTVFISDYTEMGTEAFEDAIESATNALENVTIYSENIRSNWHDQNTTGDAAEALKVSPIAQGSPRKVQWVYDAARTSQRLTRKYFEKLPKDHPARQEYEKVDWPDVPQLDLRKRENWSQSKLEAARDRIKKLNLRVAFEKEYLKALVSRTDWSRLDEKVDAAAAGAYTREEVQEAITEWTLYGVASKYFKRWFGKSKIVDDAGVPIPMYHSTPAEMIKEFQSGRRGFMSFSEDPEFANWHQLRRMGNKPESYNIVPVYIKAEKVFDYRNRAMRRSLVRQLKSQGTEQEVMALIREQMTNADMATDGTRKAAAKDLNGITTLSEMIASGSWAVYESPVVMEVLRERGYEAFWMTSWDGNVTNLGVFDVASIKSAIGNLGTFDQTINDTVYSLRAPDTNEVFQSAIAEWVDSKMGKRMPVEQAIKAFTNLSGKGIKKDEVDDIGLIEWLTELGKGQPTVTRNELLQFVRENQVQFREIEIRSPSMSMGIPLPNSEMRAGLNETAAEDNIQRIKDEMGERLRDMGYSQLDVQNIMAEYERNGTPAFDDYLGAATVNQFHAAMNEAKLDLWQARYRESQARDGDVIRTGQAQYEPYTSYYEAGYQMYDNPTYREFVITIPMQKGQTEPFKTHHWEDDNVIVHMRSWTHVDSQTGESSLFVEEVQSDWHQQGSRYGYNTGVDGSPPHGPMQHTWASLGMRRLIRYAAENGHHRVLWASGDMQRKRYDLQNMGVSRVKVMKVRDDNYSVEFDVNGQTQSSMGLSQRDLDKAIGAEIADRIAEQMEKSGTSEAELSGDEVSWTGAAVKAFYDSSSKTGLRYLTDKYIKKYGSKVQVYTDVKVINDRVDVWGFEITDKLRQKAMAGQSPYSLTEDVASEMMRRLELYQLRSYLEKNTKTSTTNRALRARLMDGAERGFYSKWIVHHSGVMVGKLNRNEMVRRIAERIASGDMVTQRNALATHVIENEIRHITAGWENPPPFEVHRDYSSLPARLRNKVITHGYQGRIEGTIDPLDGGKVHIIASNIGSIERLHRVFAEEALGHFGLRKVFGEEFRPFLKEVLPSVEGSEAWNNLLDEYPHLKRNIESGTEANALRAKLLATEELIAKQEVDQTVWQKFVAWVREWLRKHNMITNYTENDIKHVMAKVHAHIMNGDTPHAWGERNFNSMAFRDNGMVYSLYGDILKSRLETRLRDPRFQKKAPPKQYLTQMTNPQKFGLQDELAYSGIIEWLEDKHKNDPNTSVTVEQMLEVFHKNKPRYQIWSRTGRYLYPSLPISDLVRVGKMDINQIKDTSKIEEETGFFGDYLREFMDAPDADMDGFEWKAFIEYMEYYSNVDMEDFTAEKLTPRFLYEANLLQAPFGEWVGDAQIPELSRLDQQGLTSEQIGQMAGVRDFDNPVSYENSNSFIKAWMSNVLKRALNDNPMAYQKKQLYVAVDLERYGALGNVGVEYTTNRDGDIDAIVGLSGTRRREAIDAPELVEAMNGQVEKYQSDLKEWKEWDMPAGFVKPQKPELDDRLFKIIETYIKTKIEDVTDRRDFGEIPPADIIPALPEAGLKIIELMKGGNSGSGIMEFSDELGTSRATYSSTQYEEYTMQGAEPDTYGVLTIEMLDPPRGAEDVPHSTSHYAMGKANILHTRVQTRVDQDGNKVLGIEEVQSDWASAWNAAMPMEDELQQWQKRHWRLIGSVAKAANEEFGYVPFRRDTISGNYFKSLLLYDPNTDLLDAQALDFQSGIANSYRIIRQSAMTSNTFIQALSKRHPDMAKEWKKAHAEVRGLEREKESMPWVRTYPVLGLRMLTKWAVANGYDYVAWPEGSEVAQVYSSWESIAGKHQGMIIDLKTQQIQGIKLNMNTRESWDMSEMTDDQFTTYASQEWQSEAAMRDSGIPYDLDYLAEIIEEGGQNAELAKGVAGYVKAYLGRDEDADWDAAREERVFHTSDDKLYVVLPEERLYNARLHKLLYNRLLVNAAKEIAGYNKKGKWTKGGEEPVGNIFLESAYNYKKWGRRRERSANAPKGEIMTGDYWNGRIHKLLDPDNARIIDDSDSIDHGDVKAARGAQLFGRDGYHLRQKLAFNLMGYNDELGDEQYNRYPAHPRRIDTGYDIINENGDAEANVNLDRLWGWDRAAPHATVQVRPVAAAEYIHSNEWRAGDTSGQNDYFMKVETETGHELDIPLRHDLNSGVIGGGASYNYDVGSDPTASAAYYRFMYQLMKSWGIDNPAPQRVPGTLLKSLYNEVYSNLDHISDQGADLYQAYRKMFKEAFDNQNFWDQSEPGEHELNWSKFKIGRGGQPVADRDAALGEDWMPLKLGQPSPKLLTWLRKNASMETKGDGAQVMSFLLDNQDADEMKRIRRMMDSDIFGMALKPDDDLKTLNLIPYRYALGEDVNAATKAIAEEQRKIDAERTGAAEEAPKYGLENPEFPEQVWHALRLTPEVVQNTEDLEFPLSLRRPRGNDRQYKIINDKIAKAKSDMTVLDRVTIWINDTKEALHSGDILWGIKQGLLDDAASVERWEREIFGDIQDASISPYKSMHMTKNLPSVMAAIAKAGIPVMREGTFQPEGTRKGFIEIFRPLYEHPEGDLLRLWEGYAAARRSTQLIEQQNQDGTQREKLFSREEIDELLALGEQYPVFKDVFDDWNRFNGDLLNLAVEQGVLGQAEVDAWSTYDYVPFFRATEEIEGVDQRTGWGKVKAGVAGQHSGIKRLYGSEKMLGNVIENMWFNTASLIDKVYKNNAMGRVVDMLEGVAMTEVDMPWEAVRTTNAQLANALSRAGLLSKDGDTALKQVKGMTPEQRRQWSVVFRRVKPTGPNIVSVMREGKLRYYEVQDENLLRTLNGMGAEAMGGIMKAMGLSKSLLTRMITIDPGFMLANWMRDTLSAWVTSDANFVPVVDSIKSMGDVFKEDGAFVKMMMSGAGGGGFYDLTGGNVSKVIEEQFSGAHGWIPRAWRGYMKLGAASENSNRLAIANRIEQKGGTAAEAMYQAQDIMNFTMSGDWAATRFLIRTVPFLNARMQGLYRLYRGGRDHPLGFLIKGTALMAASMALLARNWDEDEYDNLEGWQKDMNWNFFVDGVHYAIPKPFEVGLMFGTVPERMMRFLLGKDDLYELKESGKRAVGETLAFNPIPQLFKPMYELGANVNLFTGNQIESIGLKNMEPPFRYSPWTSPLAVRVGQSLPEWMGTARSPVRIEHAIRAYTGTVGLYTLNSVDWVIRQFDDRFPERPARKWYEAPVLSRVIKGEAATSRYNRYADRMYRLIDKANEAQGSYNSLLRQGQMEEAEKFAEERAHLINPYYTKDKDSMFGGYKSDSRKIDKTPRRAILDMQKALRELSSKQRQIMMHPDMDADEKRSMLDETNIERRQLLEQAKWLIEELESGD